MKKLLLNIALLLSMLLALSIVLNTVFYSSFKIAPWYWGSELIQQKQFELKFPDKNYNTLLIGSSRVYRQLNPEIIDAVTVKSADTRTYNFGINWLFAPETFYVYDQLINQEQLKFKYVIFELSKIRSVDYQNLHTPRTIYFYSWQNFVFSVKSVLGANLSFAEKCYLSGIHAISFIDRIINLGYLSAALKCFNDEEISDFKSSSNGYESLFSSQQKKVAASEENASGRHNAFLNDTSVVTLRKESSARKFQKYEEHRELLEKYNVYYANVLNKMAEDARKKGITLIFLLSPRIDESQYDELIPVFHHLLPAHRIELSDSRKYPELYLAANTFDETHLNDQGAEIYSRLLGQKINELLWNQQVMKQSFSPVSVLY